MGDQFECDGNKFMIGIFSAPAICLSTGFIAIGIADKQLIFVLLGLVLGGAFIAVAVPVFLCPTCCETTSAKVAPALDIGAGLGLEDTTGDGKYDTVVQRGGAKESHKFVDTTNDGQVDTLIVDTTKDGKFDRVVHKADAPLSFIAQTDGPIQGGCSELKRPESNTVPGQSSSEERPRPLGKLSHNMYERPTYWQHAQREGDFVEVVSTEWVTGIASKLLSGTFISTRTRDRKSSMPTNLEVVNVWRIENAAVWQQYAQNSEHLIGKRRKQHGSRRHDGLNAPTKTSSLLPKAMLNTLREELNEEYLFHGTSPGGALGITRSGFDLSRAGSSAGSLYGPGLYFAECSSKSDEYATPDHDGIYEGLYAMLLCRVSLGRVLTWESEAGPALFSALKQEPYPQWDSILGDREKLRGTYKEFVLPTESGHAAYPEYVIIYRRKF